MRKIVRSNETDFTYERTNQPLPRIGPWQGQLEQFLVSNSGKPSRGRLTLIRIFEALGGLGYEGGYDAARRFAKTWSEKRGAATAEAYVPLSYALAEAYQFDWSHEVVLIAGVTIAVKVAARLAPILTWLPTAPEATKLKTVPLIVSVELTAGWTENVIAPLAATAPA